MEEEDEIEAYDTDLDEGNDAGHDEHHDNDGMDMIVDDGGQEEEEEVAETEEDAIKRLYEESLDPPPRPTDLIQSALFIPLGEVGMGHKGRKVRIIGQ